MQFNKSKWKEGQVLEASWFEEPGLLPPPPLQFKENTGGLGGLGWIRHRLVKSVGPHTEGLVSIYKTIHMLFSWTTIKLKRCGLHK